MEKDIICPECKEKVVGKYVYINSRLVPGLGNLDAYDAKYDRRKASSIGFGEGLICKKCARRLFPNGYAYKVTVDYHGKRITPFVGIKQKGWFADEAEAQKAVDVMNRRRADNYARYDKQAI